ncbi:ABC transporter [Calothrix sp. HK-06]|nr:ABC transporter [Calothrix sp. HK-06]
MRPIRKPPTLRVQLQDLLLMELTNWRWSWQSTMLTSMVAPILGIVALGSIASTSQDTNAYILTGNLVMSLMFGNLNNLASRFTFMRFAGNLDYYATLPIRREALIIATVISFFLLSLPSLLVTVIFGALFLKIHLVINPLILLVVPLCVLPLAGLGAVIGVYSRTISESDSLSLLLTMVMLFIGPVLIPANRLPSLLLSLGYLSPATYGASALRQTLLAPVTQRFFLDIIALLAFTLITFWFTVTKLDWRQS